METVAVGLSGGVDSSVAAALLKEQGFNVIGLTMKIWRGDYEIKEEMHHGCFGPGEDEDIASAAGLCAQLDIPHHLIDLTDEFDRLVLAPFRQEYRAGRTPNPCVRCNRMMKFGLMLDKAQSSGISFDRFATGHYARIIRHNGAYQLHKGSDAAKDQSYFLYGIDKDMLPRIMFPLGGMTKQDVRMLARRYGLAAAENPESQDFVAGGDYSPLFDADDSKEGEFVDEKGSVLGRHRGIVHYTIGQRRGLGISSDSPLYVKAIDPATHRITVAKKHTLYTDRIHISDINWLADMPDHPFRAEVRIRQKHREESAMVLPEKNHSAYIVFDEPQCAPAPGQSAVIFDGSMILGGGIIRKIP